MKRRGKSPLGLARSRQTKSEINVQTPTGLQNMEMLINLGYDEIIILRSINYYFENEHFFFRGQREELLFDLVNQVLDKIADGTIPLDIEKYYEGVMENEMDHANLTQMRHLLRDAGAHLFKRMYNPGIVRGQEQGTRMSEEFIEDRERYERGTSEEWN